jgi:hypothetical protein
MRLKKAQKEVLLTWIAEGLKTDEINTRAAKFKPRFRVSTRIVAYYRKRRGVKLDEIQEAGETSSLKTGLAIRENRVAKLQLLADTMLADLLDNSRLWLPQVKGIGSHDNYERVEYEEFNKAEVDAVRGVLDDIAAEVGERVRKADVTSGGKPLPRSGPDLKGLRKLSNNELAILEHAAEILESTNTTQDSAV